MMSSMIPFAISEHVHESRSIRFHSLRGISCTAQASLRIGVSPVPRYFPGRRSHAFLSVQFGLPLLGGNSSSGLDSTRPPGCKSTTCCSLETGGAAHSQRSSGQYFWQAQWTWDLCRAHSTIPVQNPVSIPNMALLSIILTAAQPFSIESRLLPTEVGLPALMRGTPKVKPLLSVSKS